MNLGGDDWPIYLEPSGKEGMKGIKVDLKPGDMLVYSGCELEHWREKLKVKNAYKFFCIITIVRPQERRIICSTSVHFRSSFLV